MELLRICVLVGTAAAMIAVAVKYRDVVEEALRRFHDTWRGGGGGPIGPAPAADPFVVWPGRRRAQAEKDDYCY